MNEVIVSILSETASSDTNEKSFNLKYLRKEYKDGGLKFSIGELLDVINKQKRFSASHDEELKMIVIVFTPIGTEDKPGVVYED